jgi:hypothetical protein
MATTEDPPALTQVDVPQEPELAAHCLSRRLECGLYDVPGVLSKEKRRIHGQDPPFFCTCLVIAFDASTALLSHSSLMSSHSDHISLFSANNVFTLHIYIPDDRESVISLGAVGF